MVGIGYGNSLIQLRTLSQKGVASLKNSSELEQVELDADTELTDEIYDSTRKSEVVEFSVSV